MSRQLPECSAAVCCFFKEICYEGKKKVCITVYPSFFGILYFVLAHSLCLWRIYEHIEIQPDKRICGICRAV